MTEQSLEGTARELVTAGKGILAADETVGTISKRFEALGPLHAASVAGEHAPQAQLVVPGKDCSAQASVTEVATATLRCLRRHVPAAVPGIVFLSGGQDERRATAHLSAMNAAPGARPWAVSFSYGRALQDPALEAWGGRPSGVKAAQDALCHRARCNGAASQGQYVAAMEVAAMEKESRDATVPAHRAHWRDD